VVEESHKYKHERVCWSVYYTTSLLNYHTDKMTVTMKKEAVRDRTKTLAEIKNTRHVQ